MVDLLRVLATVFVLVFHFSGQLGVTLPVALSSNTPFGSLDRLGSMGTDILFILSGFLLTRSLGNGTPWRTALQSRLLGIYPGFLVVLMTYLALAPLFPQVRKIPEAPVEAVQYVVSNVLLLAGVLPVAPLVTMSWALSYVVYSVMLLTLIYRIGELRGRSPIVRFFVWGTLAAAIYIMADGMTGGWGSGLGRLIFFPLGALIAESEPLLADAPAAIRYVLLSGGLVMLGTMNGSLVYAAGLTLSVAAGLFSANLNKIAGSRAWGAAAGGSYTVCLTHGFIIHALKVVMPRSVNSVSATILLTLAVAVSYVSGLVWDAYIFRPATHLFKRKLRRPIRERSTPNADLQRQAV